MLSILPHYHFILPLLLFSAVKRHNNSNAGGHRESLSGTFMACRRAMFLHAGAGGRLGVTSHVAIVAKLECAIACASRTGTTTVISSPPLGRGG